MKSRVNPVELTSRKISLPLPVALPSSSAAKQRTTPNAPRVLVLGLKLGLAMCIGLGSFNQAWSAETGKSDSAASAEKATGLAKKARTSTSRRIEAPSCTEPIKLKVATNPNTPQSVLSKLASDKDSQVRRAVAQHPSCPISAKRELARDKDQLVVEALLRNPNGLGFATLEYLAGIGQPKVCETIAANSKTPPKILSKLAHGKIQTEYLLLSLARNPSTTPDVIDRLVKIGDRLVRTFLARQDRLPKQAYALLAEDGDLGVRSMVAGNPNVAPSILDKLARDSHLVVRIGVAGNPSSLPSTLEKLSKDKR